MKHAGIYLVWRSERGRGGAGRGRAGNVGPTQADRRFEPPYHPDENVSPIETGWAKDQAGVTKGDEGLSER